VAWRSPKCWRWKLYTDDERFASDLDAATPYVVFSASDIFLSVYTDCKALLAGEFKPKKGGKRRGA
jgi:hypothetical protein